MNRLDEIIAHKRQEVEQMRLGAVNLREQALRRTEFRPFGEALKRADGKLAVIAEVKKASPSAGVIAESFDPVEIATKYEQLGADAVSVLTDEKYFHGNLEHLVRVRRSISLPVLRKDFVVDELQIAEAAAGGADAILLIVAALDQLQLAELAATAQKYQLEALVEVHTLAEMERAVDAGAEIIGINNRDLGTFTIDLSVTEKLSEQAPDDVVLVSESGIRTAEDVARVRACGVDAVLVGEALMRGELSPAQLR
jgi:indole-3-glycerol phosphate synthase